MAISEEHQKKLQEGRMKSWKWWGRPAKYTDPEELEFQVDDYFAGFETEDNKVYFKNKKGDVTWFDYKQFPTVSWLSLYLGFEDRSSLLDYCNRDEKNFAEAKENWEVYIKEFSFIIKRAKTAIEQAIENRLALGKGSPAGQIFILKNGFSWKDKTETEMYGKDGKELVPWTVQFVKPNPKDHEVK